MNNDSVLQAILLLCSFFNKNESKSIKPLTPTEYSRLASWLHHNKYTPADFLDRPNELLSKWEDPKPKLKKPITKERLSDLLQRAASMGFAIEKWQQQNVWVLSRASHEYPRAIKTALADTRPPLLFGIGNKELLNTAGIGFVGSRDTNSDDDTYTQALATQAVEQGFTVVSGGAKGVDEVSMLAALDAGGSVIGVIADSLLKKATKPQYRKALQEGRLLLITPYYPEAGFDPGLLQGRNKFIYLLSAGVVVAKSAEKGGTWNGATENLKKQWVPLWVRDIEQTGNQKLIELGGQAISSDKVNFADLQSSPGQPVADLDMAEPAHQPKESQNDNDDSDIQDVTVYCMQNVEPIDATDETRSLMPETEPQTNAPAEPSQSALGVFLNTFYQELKNQKDTTLTPKALAEKYPELSETIIKQWLNTLDEQGLVQRQGKKLAYTLIAQESLL